MTVDAAVGAQEQGRVGVVLVEPVRQLVEVSDEHHGVAAVGHRVDDLGGDFGAFALVGGRERFVADQKRVCVDSPGDFAHSGELFVELAAGHGGVLFALVVSEDAAGDSRAVGAGGDEHACLHHQLGHSEAAQERRGAPCIHAEFGEAEAILAALALVNRAYGLTWKSVFGCGHGREARALEYIERYLGVGGLLNGQSMDLNYASLHTANSPRADHTVTEAIAMGKTVSLIRLTLVLPGILGDASPGELQLLDRVAICWGLTYQIVDDLKDLLQSSEESGKTVSRDMSMGRPNIALAIGIDRAIARLKRLIVIGDRMLDRLVALRPGVAFLQELRVQLDGEAAEIIDNACESSVPKSLQGAA